MKNNNNSTKIHTTIDLNQQLAKKRAPGSITIDR
jgi:hypothetical protein